MSKEEPVRVGGVVKDVLANTRFRVQLDDTEVVVMATISGKMRMNNIRVLPGDRVILELSPYDMTKGRIVYRE